jgi:hypothetical protein
MEDIVIYFRVYVFGVNQKTVDIEYTCPNGRILQGGHFDRHDVWKSREEIQSASLNLAMVANVPVRRDPCRSTRLTQLQPPTKYCPDNTSAQHYFFNQQLHKMAPTSELEALLRRGPGNLPITDALNDLRYKILVDGIPANSDGLVSRVNSPVPMQDLLTILEFRVKPGYIFGLFFSMPLQFQQIHTSTSYTKVRAPPTPRSATIPFEHWPQTHCFEDE